jgi:hypothetical protein
MGKIDIIAKSFSRDLLRLNYLLISAKKYLTGFNEFIVVLEDDLDCRRFAELHEDGFFKFYFVPPVLNNGYIYQQFVKLNGLGLSSADYLLPLDSDMVFFRYANCSDWFVDGKPYLPYGNWVNAVDFPTVELMAAFIHSMSSRTHDLRLISDAIVNNLLNIDLNITVNNERTLKFDHNGRGYEVSKARLHDTWISSIKNIVSSPIDTMRSHYIFERDCLKYVKFKIETYTGLSMEEGIFKIDYFPVFSEYQVYGNLIYESEFRSKYLFVKEPEYYSSIEKMPVIKCNSRVDSVFDFCNVIVDGVYELYQSRSKVLEDVRKVRSSFPSEDWG